MRKTFRYSVRWTCQASTRMWNKLSSNVPLSSQRMVTVWEEDNARAPTQHVQLKKTKLHAMFLLLTLIYQQAVRLFKTCSCFTLIEMTLTLRMTCQCFKSLSCFPPIRIFFRWRPSLKTHTFMQILSRPSAPTITTTTTSVSTSFPSVLTTLPR